MSDGVFRQRESIEAAFRASGDQDLDQAMALNDTAAEYRRLVRDNASKACIEDLLQGLSEFDLYVLARREDHYESGLLADGIEDPSGPELGVNSYLAQIQKSLQRLRERGLVLWNSRNLTRVGAQASEHAWGPNGR